MRLEDGDQDAQKNLSRESIHPESACYQNTTPCNTHLQMYISFLNVSFMTQLIKYMC